MNDAPNVMAEHPGYTAMKAKWTIIRDVVNGEAAVKSKRLTYLPLADTEENAEAFAERYLGYLTRAVFYNATSRTLDKLVGQVFSKSPVYQFTSEAEFLRDDPAGNGVTLEQHAKSTLNDVLSVGRYGLWVDFPTTDGNVSVADIEDGIARPVVLGYKAEDILNWRVIRVGSKQKYSLVVLREDYVANDDGFTMQIESQYRELRLENGVYIVRIWRGGNVFSSATPLDSNGNPFNEIPFVFVGIKENDEKVDNPPLYDLAVMNLAHYRNSADFEESCFMVGQPTPYYVGVDTGWIQTVWQNKVRLGSRGGVPLPKGGSAGLLQVSENTIVKGAMDQKEAQMVALGAGLITAPSVTKTATEVNSDKTNEISILASAASNTASAYKRAFELCAKFLPNLEVPTFELSTDFDMTRMTSQEILAIVATWQAKLLTTEEARDILHRAGYATVELADAISGGVLEKPEGEKPTAPVDNRSKSGGSAV